MKRILVIILISLCLALCIGAYLLFYYNKTDNLTAIPKQDDYDINYNNYSSNDVRLDFKYGRSAFTNGFLLTVIEPNGDTNKLFYRGDSFQLYKNGIVYLEGNKLKLLEDGKKGVTIASDVYKFTVKNDSVLYCSDSTLYSYDIATKTFAIIAEDVIAFQTNDESLIVLSRVPNEGHFDSIFNVYNNNGDVIKSLSFKLTYEPFNFMITNDNIVYEDNNSIFFLNINTGEIKNVSLSERTIQDYVRYIVNDEVLFVSFQARKYDGSLSFYEGSEDNGVWRIDLKTLDKVKITDQSFDELFLFGDLLVATKSNKIYSIFNDGTVTSLLD